MNLRSWNYTAPGSNTTSYFNGTCGTPGAKSAGPWCYVEPSTCKNAPIKDTSGLAYDNCAAVTSTHTMDTGGASMYAMFETSNFAPIHSEGLGSGNS